jgi:hypothetical protein
VALFALAILKDVIQKGLIVISVALHKVRADSFSVKCYFAEYQCGECCMPVGVIQISVVMSSVMILNVILLLNVMVLSIMMQNVMSF